MRVSRYLISAALILSASSAVFAGEDRMSRLERHVYTLSSDEAAGRKAGSPEGACVAEYIASAFEEAGLYPFYAGEYIDEFTAEPLVGKARKTYRNVAGILYGRNLELDGQYLIIGAHFDHLGVAPDGVAYSGADDNASGVAAMIELAHSIKECVPGRNVIFVAFDGEEGGLLGSRHFHRELPILSENITLMVNLQMIGKYAESGALYLYAKEVSERALVNFSGAGYGMKLVLDHDGFKERSDSEPFALAGIPSVHVTTGQGTHFHTTADQPQLIDYKGLDNITGLLTEALCNIANDASLDRVPSGRIEGKKGRRVWFDGGVTASLGSSFVRGADAQMRGKTLFSYGAGLYGQLNTKYIGLRPEVQFIHSGSRYEPLRMKMNSVVVPFSFVVQTPRYLAGSLHVLAGGYYRYSFSGKSAGADMDFSQDFYRNGAGVQWGIGLKFRKFGIEAVSRYGLTDMTRHEGEKLRERATYCTLSYTF